MVVNLCVFNNVKQNLMELFKEDSKDNIQKQRTN